MSRCTVLAGGLAALLCSAAPAAHAQCSAVYTGANTLSAGALVDFVITAAGGTPTGAGLVQVDWHVVTP